MLCLFEEQPEIARLCVVEPDSAPEQPSLRNETLAVLARRVDDGRLAAARQPPDHTAQAVVAGAIGALRAHLLEADETPVSQLLAPLMSFIVLPYRGVAASRRELDHAA
jgi:hypothetical protein